MYRVHRVYELEMAGWTIIYNASEILRSPIGHLGQQVSEFRGNNGPWKWFDESGIFGECWSVKLPTITTRNIRREVAAKVKFLRRKLTHHETAHIVSRNAGCVPTDTWAYRFWLRDHLRGWILPDPEW